MKNNIDKILKAKKISVVDLAKKLNTSEVQIHRLKSGQRRLTLEWIERLAKALDCSPSDIISESTQFEVNGTTSSRGAIDPERLRSSYDAVENIIKERKLKLKAHEISDLLAEVYSQSLKFEMKGDAVSPRVVAELLINKS